MGVSYELFWTLCPELLEPFTRAFERKLEMEDEVLWRQGLYNRMAVASVLSKEVKYYAEPLLKKAKLENDPKYQQQRNLEHFLDFMNASNRAKQKKGVGPNG